MTYVEWEGELLKCLSSLPEKEKHEAISYYRELHSDKRDAGLSDEDIINNFGSPIDCAAKILMENTAEENDGADEDITEDGNNEAKKKIAKETRRANNCYSRSDRTKSFSAAKIVGWFFLTVLFIIPFVSVIISAIAALAASTVAGFATAVAGVIIAIASPLGLFLGYSGLTVLATAGASIAAAGIGILIFEAFYIITKYSVTACIRIVKYLFERRKQK